MRDDFSKGLKKDIKILYLLKYRAGSDLHVVIMAASHFYRMVALRFKDVQ